MAYADDTIWLLFGLGLAIIIGVAVVYVFFGVSGWASLGFLITGALVSASYYLVGTHPPVAAAGDSANAMLPPPDEAEAADVPNGDVPLGEVSSQTKERRVVE